MQTNEVFPIGKKRAKYLRDEDKIINVELQNGHRLELPKRSRYYQAAADVDNTPPGGLYSKMKDNYVIFICTFDPFLQGKAFYKFEYFCKKYRKRM